MATIDDDLGQIERDIRQLKIEYDQYFGGGRKRPPAEIEWRIDLLIKRYAERAGELSYAQRFRYNNLTQTYAKYKDIFRKRLQQKEEGTVQHHFGSAARAIEAERARLRAAEALKDKAAAPAAVATTPEPPAPFRMASTARSTCPTSNTSGVESWRAQWIPMLAWVAPGPRVTTHTPGVRVALA